MSRVRIPLKKEDNFVADMNYKGYKVVDLIVGFDPPLGHYFFQIYAPENSIDEVDDVINWHTDTFEYPGFGSSRETVIDIINTYGDLDNETTKTVLYEMEKNRNPPRHDIFENI